MNFSEIDKYIIPLDTFSLSWRFNDEKYDKLPDNHLKELKPFNQNVSQFLDNLLKEKNSNNQFPFNKDIYPVADKIKILDGKNEKIKNWLNQRNLSPDNSVYLSWDCETSLKTKWEIVIEYWDSIYYPGSDDLTIFDESMEWILLFFHENEIYWGANKPKLKK